MSEFSDEVNRRVAEEQARQANIAATEAFDQAARPVVFDRFLERVKEGAAILVSRGMAPEVTKDIVEYQQKKKWLSRETVTVPVNRSQISGWMLNAPDPETTMLVSQTTKEGDRVFLKGTFMGTDGQPYQIVRDTEALRIKSYEEMASVFGILMLQHTQPEDTMKEAERLENIVASATARVIRGEQFIP